MEAGASGVHAALPKDTSAEQAEKPCMLGTVCSALAQEAELEEAISSGFPCVPFPILLGLLRQHRTPIRWFCIPLE